MVTLQKSGDSAVKFVFTDSDHYLYGSGQLETPVNSLLLVLDESEMVTFKKLSGDPFLSFRADNSNLGTKAAIEQFYKDNMVGSTGGGSGSGITSGDVETMIDAALDDYYDKDEVDAAFETVNASLSGKASVSDVTAVANDVSTLSGQVATKVAITDFNTYSAATDSRLAEDEEVTAAALNDLQENKADTSAVTAAIDAAISGKADTSAVTAAIDDAKAYYISFATLATVGIHDEDWDGIVAAIDDHRPIYAGYPRTDGGIIYYGVECMNKNVSNTEIVMTASDNSAHYFYTFTKNGSNDYSYTVDTRPYTTNQEKTAWNAKQDTLSAGTGIEISGNVISATGGGGATYSAGTNISIDTANTINCTLPITANSTTFIAGSPSKTVNSNILIGSTDLVSTAVTNSVTIGYGAKGGYSTVVIGQGATGGTASKANDIAIGVNAKAQGGNFIAIGSNTNATGTTKMNLNNQIKVDTNNQVYIKDKTNTTDVCIQDAIAALGGLKLVSLTQSEYENLATKDANTLYIINNVVS